MQSLNFWFLDFVLLHFNPAVAAQISNPNVELVIPTGIPTKQAKAEMETYSVNVETRIVSVQYH